jgi:uncharacterized membrane protein YraQ (UPF0718 family)
LILNRFRDDPVVEESEDISDAPKPPVLVRIFRHGFITIAGDIAVPLSIGIFMSGLLSAFVDPQSFSEIGDGLIAKLIVVAAATPLYVCATASVPIGASMLVAGLSPGTVFVFLMAGPATNAATFTTISKLLGKREALTYLVSAIILAVLMGYLLDFLVPVLPDIKAAHLHDHEGGTLFQTAAAILLLTILVAGKVMRNRS